MTSPLFMRRITRVPSDTVVPESNVAVQDKLGACAEAAEATLSNNPATTMVIPPDLVMIFSLDWGDEVPECAVCRVWRPTVALRQLRAFHCDECGALATQFCEEPAMRKRMRLCARLIPRSMIPRALDPKIPLRRLDAGPHRAPKGNGSAGPPHP